MIQNRKEYLFYRKADLMMNRGVFHLSIKQKIEQLLYPDNVMKFLTNLRKVEYYGNLYGRLPAVFGGMKIYLVWLGIKQNKLSLKCGFSIAPNVLGYGVTIPHYGTIVVGAHNTIGNYAVLQTGICISSGSKKIGNAFYAATGAKILNDICIGDNVSVEANAVVTKSCNEDGVLLIGVPAIVKKKSVPWYVRDGEISLERYNQCENLKEYIFN